MEEGGDVSAFDSFTLEDAGGDKAPPKGDQKGEAAESSEPPSKETGTAPAPAKEETPAPTAQESESTGARLQTALDREPAASPAAKRAALEKGVPISKVKGTGPGGRITLTDIEKFQPATSASQPVTSSGAALPAYTDTPASSMRKTIASRLTESVNQNPHYFVASSVSVTKLLALRQALNTAAQDGAYKLSVNDFLIKAVAVAARRVPAANSSWRVSPSGETIIRTHHTVDVSVAVATPVGLMTPIVAGADSLGLQAISARVKDLGKRARDGKLKPEEYQGGTVTISNMGMNAAVERFTAVINPPQAMILAVGATRKVAVPKEEEDGVDRSEVEGVKWDDQIVLTASFDHKVVDGAVGGEFMRELKKVVENPLELML